MHPASLPLSCLLYCGLLLAPPQSAAQTTASTTGEKTHAATAQGHAGGYRYVYYPEQRLYYSTEQQIWFWQEGSAWNYGVHLPSEMRERLGTGLPLRLATTRPFQKHAYVERRYGEPWRAREAKAQAPSLPSPTTVHEVREGDLAAGEQG